MNSCNFILVNYTFPAGIFSTSFQCCLICFVKSASDNVQKEMKAFHGKCSFSTHRSALINTHVANQCFARVQNSFVTDSQ